MFYIIWGYFKRYCFADFFLSKFVLYIREGNWLLWVNFVSKYLGFLVLVFGGCCFHILSYHWQIQILWLLPFQCASPWSFSAILLIALAKTSSTILNKSREKTPLYHYSSDIRGMNSVFLFMYDYCICSLYYVVV